jgi:tetratricopeptide (TPR) repeat protein
MEGKQVCGTPGYLAPEVFRGEGADVRSDIYSFGLVLWQMAAGSQVPPFAVGVAPPRHPRDIDRYGIEIYEQQMRKSVPAVGEPLEAIIERCLAPEPSKRFSSFTQLRGELEPILYCRTGQTLKWHPVGERDSAFWNNKGCSLLNLGRLEEALVCLRKGLGINPDDVTAHINLGVALAKKGDRDGAIAECRTALRLQPDRALAHANLGTELSDKGDRDGAISEFRTALRLQPDLAIAHNGLGLALILKGDLDGAIAEYHTGLHLQPDDAWAHSGLGLALRKKGDLDGAIAEYRTALRLQPDDVTAHNGLGVALSDRGDLDGAIAEFRTELRLQPDRALAHTNLGAALSDKGDLDGAITEFRTAIRLQPDDVTAHYYFGDALWKKGDREAALEELHRAYILAPNEPTIRQTYENLMRQLKPEEPPTDPTKFRPSTGPAEQEAPSGDRNEYNTGMTGNVGFNQLAEQLISKRQWVAARSLLEEAIRQMPMDWKPVQNDSVTFRARICACWDKEEFLAYVGAKRAEGDLDNKWIAESYSKAWFQLAVIAVEEGNLTSALSCIESGLALEPDHPSLWIEKGFILARQGQYADALRSYERAATVRDWAPPNQIAWALRGRGYTLVELKRIDEAEEAIKQSLVLDPQSEIGRDELEYIIQLRRVCKEGS